jgi:hypothetical protein
MEFPCLPEPDMAQTDRPPGEDRREARHGKHPVPRLLAFIRRERDDVAQTSKRRGEQDRDERPALAVDITEDLGGLAVIGEGGERAGGAVDGGVADAEDGD